LNTSWMVGFAPADNPEIAFAAVVANSDKWHIKSGHIIKKALNTFFELKSRKKNKS
ncbi:MAG: hypothetical protein FJ088_12480, partial [Deltaproteobacteria bacterium]|nr:hypothetical protein [Deltaproteobacteria bacterium]